MFGPGKPMTIYSNPFISGNTTNVLMRSRKTLQKSRDENLSRYLMLWIYCNLLTTRWHASKQRCHRISTRHGLAVWHPGFIDGLVAFCVVDQDFSMMNCGRQHFLD